MEFQVGERTYRARNLTAFQQFHIVRRLLPLVSSLVGVARDGSLRDAAAGDNAGINMDVVFGTFGPMSEALAKLPDADVDYVINTALGVVDFKVDGDRGWQRLSPSPGQLMIQELDLAALFEIVRHVLEANLAGFFASLQRLAPQAVEEMKG